MPGLDYYELLGVPEEAGDEEILRAYRTLAKRFHPDSGGAHASTERMAQINEAFRCLSDAKRRKAHDARRRTRRAKRRQPQAAERPAARILTLAPGLDLPLVRVAAGRFLMGGCTGVCGSGDPERIGAGLYPLTLPEYYIGIHPVTVAQYAAFVQATGRLSTPWPRRTYSFDPTSLGAPELLARHDRNWQHPHGGASNVTDRGDHPVMVVTWHDAVAFCAWASEITGTRVRLPSAAEWQKAARGADGRCYPWGNSPNAQVGTCNCLREVGRAGDTRPVGSFPATADSPCGCADMLGNVWEWTSTKAALREGDVRFDHPYRPGDGREEPGGGDPRLLMGGSFLTPCEAVCCTAVREQGPFHASDTGFRVCVTP